MDILKSIAPIIASLIAVLSAWFSLRATRGLEKAKRTYTLLNRDLDRLEEFNLSLVEVSLPSIEKAHSILELEEPERSEKFQKIYSEMETIYNTLGSKFLARKSLIDADLTQRMEDAMNKADKAQKSIEVYVYRYEACCECLRVLQDQIERTRGVLKNA